MRKSECTNDYQGRELVKGDTVAVLSDNSSARVADIATDGDQAFVRLRPLHQPYSKGVWHAADQVVWLSGSKKSKKPEATAATAATSK
jgi:hypothetical protein